MVESRSTFGRVERESITVKSHPVETAIELILPALFRVSEDHRELARSAAEGLMSLIDVEAFRGACAEVEIISQPTADL